MALPSVSVFRHDPFFLSSLNGNLSLDLAVQCLRYHQLPEKKKTELSKILFGFSFNSARAKSTSPTAPFTQKKFTLEALI